MAGVTISGLAGFPEINIRSGPNTSYQRLFKAAVGVSGLTVLDVQPDDQGQTSDQNNKLYQWFRLRFADGKEGWARDDLLTLEAGDWSAFGYGVVAVPTVAFSLERQKTQVTPTGPDRIRKAAFAITTTFEGGSYATYQNYDKGVVSYGRFQFTLASGSLFNVLERYLAASNTSIAADLRSYLPRVQAREEALRNDVRFKELLIQAAGEQAMKDAQDAVATAKYWDDVQGLSIKPRNIQTALGQALIFDMAINHGARHDMLGLAEDAVGIKPPKSPVPDLATEKKLITALAQIRRDRLYRLADKNNLPGLRVRGDFWVTLTQGGDWDLQGDASGNLNVKGRMVQVRNP